MEKSVDEYLLNYVGKPDVKVVETKTKKEKEKNKWNKE